MKQAWTIGIAVLGISGALALPVLAQSDSGGTVATRIDRLEKEMHAVQRKVFPGGADDMVQPEIQPQEATVTAAGTPATTPVADLTARVDALERQLTQLTSDAEQGGYKQRQLDDQLTKLKSDYDYRLSALEKGSAPPPIAGGDPDPPVRTATRDPVPATPPTSIDTATPPGAPSTGDPAEDAYMTGYRLWTARKYPEAETALKAAAAKYPDSKRASYSQNLLGRAYLDEGKPGLAADAFYQNYKKNPRGDRAPDSLYFLGQSLTQLKKPADACKVYTEFDDVYGDKAIATLKAKVTQGKADAKCGG